MALTLLLILFLPALSEAGQDVTFQWDPYTDNEPVVGFKLYMSTAPNVAVIPANLAATIPGKATTTYKQLAVPSGMKYWVLTAYTAAMESEKSNEVSYLVKLKPPSGLSTSQTLTFSNMKVTVTQR